MSEAPNRRLQRRRRLQDPPTVEISFCGEERCLGAVRNEHLQGLGLVFHGRDAMRAWDHRSCCLGRTIELRIAEDPVQPGRPPPVDLRLPVRLIHLTRPVPKHLPCNAGVSLDREHLGPEDVEDLLALWARLQDS